MIVLEDLAKLFHSASLHQQSRIKGLKQMLRVLEANLAVRVIKDNNIDMVGLEVRYDSFF